MFLIKLKYSLVGNSRGLPFKTREQAEAAKTKLGSAAEGIEEIKKFPTAKQIKRMRETQLEEWQGRAFHGTFGHLFCR